ncbi:unnamed protein product [Paramecium sonneborni]|uniref:Uncharacterized protein n=1 Tax=Paramecium sonneborni TaxID=65129 RepID=A0A8S1RMS8_9CILI|nr:unnamed protein product [Paramecium sonneborni]
MNGSIRQYSKGLKTLQCKFNQKFQRNLQMLFNIYIIMLELIEIQSQKIYQLMKTSIKNYLIQDQLKLCIRILFKNVKEKQKEEFKQIQELDQNINEISTIMFLNQSE